MPNVPRLFRVSALAVTILSAFTAAHADEGLWTFDNFPVKVRWIAN